jgi:predicted DNA-binding transcriptional regulator
MKMRRSSRSAGLALLVLSVIAFIIYAYFLLATQWGIMILQFTVLGVIATLLGVLAWIGYTIATASRAEEKEF